MGARLYLRPRVVSSWPPADPIVVPLIITHAFLSTIRTPLPPATSMTVAFPRLLLLYTVWVLVVDVALADDVSSPTYILDPSFSLGSTLASSVTAVAACVDLSPPSLAGAAFPVEIHVAQRGHALPPILVLNQAGELLRTYGSADIILPHGLVAQSVANSTCHIWVTDIQKFTVMLMDSHGRVISTIGTPGVNGSGIHPPQFDVPADIAVSYSHEPIPGFPFSAASVFVSDGDGGFNNRILNLEKKAADQWSTAYVLGGLQNSTAPGEFSSPHSLDIHFYKGQKYLWVADRGNSRIQVFHVDGNARHDAVFVGEWNVMNCAAFTGLPVAVFTPFAIRVDSERQRVIIADGTNGLVWIMDVATSGPTFSLPLCRTVQPQIEVCLDRSGDCKPHLLAVEAQSGDVYLAGVSVAPFLQRYTLSQLQSTRV